MGKASSTKTRVSKHASDVRHPDNSNCSKCSEHLRECRKMAEPYFRVYPFFYVDDASLRHFMERRIITQWRPILSDE